MPLSNSTIARTQRLAAAHTHGLAAQKELAEALVSAAHGNDRDADRRGQSAMRHLSDAISEILAGIDDDGTPSEVVRLHRIGG